MPRVSVNGVDLYYEEHGEGVPILGIHGTPSSAAMWADAALELAKHGRCIIYDRRGFYRSAPPEPFKTMDLIHHVDDAAALLAALHAGPAVVIGRSTGGQIALELARRFPDKVKALVLLEPALFTIDPKANAWAADARRRLLRQAAVDPSMLAEALVRDALGDEVWDSFPSELQDMFAATGPAVLAEMRGHGLDLAQDPVELSEDELAGIRRPALIVTAEDSLEACRLVNARLAGALPFTESVLVPGGHLINPAHPAVLSFIDRLAARPTSWT
ncbi:pimeloyl-ACP methyl ester carboxylesterase [Arthrobacter sp. V4I6]|uniref:alpha/beta fold hydrolase n=1 Tax=unclassified Arthrobacter TaxID=235627 RepID=UPI002785A0E9|nr:MULTISPECIES: alpha/beta hydrolase [unclassified Arthrobacter]MDQ0820761.1 pimeloyl-ACP methyl ester carboxylesterase [Arthrobacter sp. V1I7]MDQ0855023.1 pimeloyl-ACP methyl ester carboxylesterase [Arthrobacter sp. V4I6]